MSLPDLSTLRLGASNPEDEWAYGIADEQAARLADQVLAEQHRPEGVGRPGGTGPAGPARDWSGLNKGHLNGGE